MTTPYDEGHPAVGGGQAWQSVNVQKTPGGDVLIYTLRVPNATVTAVLSKADADVWVRQFAAKVAEMSSLVIAPAGTAMPPMNGNGRDH